MTPEDLASQAPPETSPPAKTPAPADSSALSWPEPPAAPHSSQEPTTGARRFSAADFEAAARAVTNRERAQSRAGLRRQLLRRLALAALIAAIVEAVWLLENFGPVEAAAFVLCAGVVIGAVGSATPAMRRARKILRRRPQQPAALAPAEMTTTLAVPAQAGLLRRLPALLAVAGIVLVVVGSITTAAQPPNSGPETVVLSSDPPATMPPLISAFSSDTPSPSLTPIASLSDTWAPTPTPTPTPTATPIPTPTPVTHTVTRIVFTRARVDLPVITAPTDEKFPYCDVAERMAYYGEPGDGGVTYLYAHATHYFFGGLLAASWQPDSYLMVQQIQIYTSDDLVYTYAVTEIHRHVDYRSFDIANNMVGEALLLQTCENNDAAGPKLIVVARPVKVETARHAAAHPPTTPRVCAHGY